MKKIFIDLDGTIVNLYGVDNWLKKLRDFDASPYIEANPLLDVEALEEVLLMLQNKGYKICILSALAKVTTPSYDVEVTNAKIIWLNNHFKKINFDEVIIIPYNTPKEQFGSDMDIIVDDSESIRCNWKGIAFDEKNIIDNLSKL